jgi:hypothetical protein
VDTYWYGFSPEWHQFLSQARISFLVLGCVDRDVAYAVPGSEIERILGDIHRTGERHWHLLLGENESGSLDLILRNGARVALNKFEIRLAK